MKNVMTRTIKGIMMNRVTNKMKRLSLLPVLMSALLCTTPAFADNGIIVPQNHVSDFPNEYVSVQTRKVGFEYDDVVIPGNAGMNIVVTRRQSGESVKFYDLLMKTSNAFASDFPVTSTTCLGDFQHLTIMYKGRPLTHAGYKETSDLPADVIAAFTDNNYLACDKTDDTIAVLHFADGRKHSFTQILSSANEFSTNAQYATGKTIDRYDNSITYAYEADTKDFLAKRLKTITRNDGEVVNFVYATIGIDYDGWEPEYLKEITYSGKKVQYDFTGKKLNAFTDAQGRVTQYEYGMYTGIGNQIVKITLPDGLTASYSHSALIDNGSLRLPEEEESGNTTFSLADMGYSGGQLVSKTISGPGISQRVYTYAATTDGSVVATLFNYKDDLELMTLYDFQTIKTANLYGSIRQVSVYEGALENSDTRRYYEHTLVYQQVTTWKLLGNFTVGCSAATIGNLQTPIPSPLICSRWVKSTETTIIPNSDGSDTFITEELDHNVYGLPTKLTEAFGSKSKMTTQTFEHDVENWILNQPLVTRLGTNTSTLETVKERT